MTISRPHRIIHHHAIGSLLKRTGVALRSRMSSEERSEDYRVLVRQPSSNES